jgi:hypothetical protein
MSRKTPAIPHLKKTSWILSRCKRYNLAGVSSLISRTQRWIQEKGNNFDLDYLDSSKGLPFFPFPLFKIFLVLQQPN